MTTLRELLHTMVERKASDLHIAVGTAAQFRIDGALVPASETILDEAATRSLCCEVISPDQIAEFEKVRELDFAFPIENLSRFRANLYFQKDTVAGAFRTIPINIPSIETLKVPNV